MSNNADNRRDDMNDEFDAIIAKAAARVAKERGAKLPIPDHEVECSDRYKQEMARMIKSSGPKPVTRFLKVAACFAVVCIVLFTGMFAGVEAFRTSFINFFFDKDAPGSEYNYNTNINNPYEGKLVTLHYIPDGFEYSDGKVDFSNGFEYIEFVKDPDLWFHFTIKPFYANNITDTEDADVEYLEINGHEAAYISKSTHNSLIWSDEENAFSISGNISKKDILKISLHIELIE